jgi:phage protein D
MARKLLRKVFTAVMIAGEIFPVMSWKATLANQGNMGTFSAEGALSDLIASGLDVIAASQDAEGAECDIYVGYDDETELIFSGVVDSCDLDWDEDKFSVKGRDHSASFADGKQTMAKLNYRNQTVGQMVQQICDEFGFDAEIDDPGIKAGPLMNGEHSFNPQPRSYWNLLQELAENSGCECYMKPDQTLYFGKEKEESSITVNYGAPPESDAENPGWGLKVSYNPRNNSNIEVKALSYNSQTTESISASAKATQVKTGKGRKTKKSIGGRKRKVKATAKHSGSRAKHKSVHYIRCAGLTADQAQARCQGAADALAKRQIIVEMSIEGLTKMKIHSQVTLKETQIPLYGFANIPLNVAEVNHEFTTPGDGDSSGGFVTSFRAMAQIESV